MKKSNDEPPVMGIFVFLYLLILLICSFMQASTASYNESRHADVCDTTYRYDYIFPARAIGCWLGTQVK